MLDHNDHFCSHLWLLKKRASGNLTYFLFHFYYRLERHFSRCQTLWFSALSLSLITMRQAYKSLRLPRMKLFFTTCLHASTSASKLRTVFMAWHLKTFSTHASRCDRLGSFSSIWRRVLAWGTGSGQMNSTQSLSLRSLTWVSGSRLIWSLQPRSFSRSRAFSNRQQQKRLNKRLMLLIQCFRKPSLDHISAFPVSDSHG